MQASTKLLRMTSGRARQAAPSAPAARHAAAGPARGVPPHAPPQRPPPAGRPAACRPPGSRAAPRCARAARCRSARAPPAPLRSLSARSARTCGSHKQPSSAWQRVDGASSHAHIQALKQSVQRTARARAAPVPPGSPAMAWGASGQGRAPSGHQGDTVVHWPCNDLCCFG